MKQGPSLPILKHTVFLLFYCSDIISIYFTSSQQRLFLKCFIDEVELSDQSGSIRTIYLSPDKWGSDNYLLKRATNRLCVHADCLKLQTVFQFCSEVSFVNHFLNMLVLRCTKVFWLSFSVLLTFQQAALICLDFLPLFFLPLLLLCCFMSFRRL